MDIKNIIIFLVVFFLIMWLQHNDDKKFDKTKNRTSLYDKIKIPLVSAIFIILVKEIDLNNYFNFIMPAKTPSIEIPTPKNTLNDIFVGPPDF